MNSKVIDFRYVQEEQKRFLEHLESSKGIKYQDAESNVPYWIILALQSELAEILNASKVHKVWSNEDVNREHLIEECADFLAHLGNLSNMLRQEFLLEIEEVQATAVETTFNRMAYWITTLNLNVRHARSVLKNNLIPFFIELVYSLGFCLDELEEAYKAKMEKNYSRFQ